MNVASELIVCAVENCDEEPVHEWLEFAFCAKHYKR